MTNSSWKNFDGGPDRTHAVVGQSSRKELAALGFRKFRPKLWVTKVFWARKMPELDFVIASIATDDLGVAINLQANENMRVAVLGSSQ
jgi:hypothetical protein